MRRIMYIENKGENLDGPARIGWVELSRSRRTYRYGGRHLAKVGSGYKYNCIDQENGDEYWISGPHRDGADKLYGVVQSDEDARVAYWTEIRRLPAFVDRTEYRAGASTRTPGSFRRNERRSPAGARR